MLKPMQRSRHLQNRELLPVGRAGAVPLWRILSIPVEDDPSVGGYGLLDARVLDEPMPAHDGLLSTAGLTQSVAMAESRGATTHATTWRGPTASRGDGSTLSDFQVANYLEDAWDAVSDGFGASGDFGSNYMDMREANTIGADKYFHCKANCEAARRGGPGAGVAELLSDSREWFDQNVRGDSPQASRADQAANSYGRSQAIAQPTMPCSAICARYRPAGLDPKH